MNVRDSIMLALNSGYPVTLSPEEAQEVYDALETIRLARAPKICPGCGKPVGLPTNRYMPANVGMGDKVWHGYCAPSHSEGTAVSNGQADPHHKEG